MPRRIDDDDEMPRRRRRGAKAVAIEAEDERGLVMRILLHSPKDMVAGLLAAAAVCAILANALFLQAGRHPSPMFGIGRDAAGAASRRREPVAAPAPGRTRGASRRSRGRSRSRGADPRTGRDQERRCQKCRSQRTLTQ